MDNRNITSRKDLLACTEIVKEYDPKPKNKDGSIRWFLYRWDDGKDGIRYLARNKENSEYYLIQSYRLYKDSERNNIFEDWYSIKDEAAADRANRKYTGLQWELTHEPFIRFRNEEIYEKV